jgi:hypothetical protein
MKLKIHFFITIVFAFIFANTLIAQTTYTATASGNWSTMTWSPVGVPGPSDNVIIPDADTVTINQNFTINDLTVGGGTSGVLQFSKTDTTVIVINGNILVQAGATFKVQTNTNGGTGLLHTLNLKGNLTHNGAVLDFRSGTSGSTLSVCNLTLSGTTNSTLTISTPYTTTNGDFNAVTINKTGGAKVILGSNIAVSGGSSTGPAILNSIMTFVSGIIETGNYIWICQTSTEANVNGYSSVSYINGAMGRGMSNSVGSTKNFPVGDANAFRLFNLRSTTSGAATGHYAIVRCVPGNANTGSSTLLGDIDKVSNVRYYQVGYNNLLGSGAASMIFDRFRPSYGADDGVIAGNTLLRVAYSTDNRATWNKINQTIPHTTVIAVSDPQTMITPDSLASTVTLSAGVFMYISLADSIGGPNPLPVELSSFTANANGRDITLNWETKTETNTRQFEIDRALLNGNGSSFVWAAIGSVKAAGTSVEPNQYSYIDKNQKPGKFQYRLKMVDNDGSFRYSKIVESEITLPKNFELSQNYPNPFNPSTKIDYNLPSDSKVILEIYSINGERIIQLVNETQTAGFYTLNFASSLSNKALASGIYFYRLMAIDNATGNQFSFLKKMILLK